jgi:release factor glutamine methyltransferase
MTRREALLEGTRILAEQGPRGSETPSLDASLLLAAALSIEKDRLLSSLPDGIDEASRGRFLGLVAERAKGRPVAYLVGRKEFWGHEFYVDERVLVPRPDTELLVELALREGCRIGAERATRGAADGSARAVAPCHAPLGLHEACTGSGCVAISLALERPGWKVSASDISPGALAVARRNAMLLLPTERAGGDVDFLEADLLDLHDPDAGPAREAAAGGVSAACREAKSGDAGLRFDLILANPPYVESGLARELAGAWGEPLLALDGGSDGLDPYRLLVPQAFALLSPGGALLLEADPDEMPAIRDLLSGSGFEAVETASDLAGLARVTLGRKPWTSA